MQTITMPLVNHAKICPSEERYVIERERERERRERERERDFVVFIILCFLKNLNENL